MSFYWSSRNEKGKKNGENIKTGWDLLKSNHIFLIVLSRWTSRFKAQDTRQLWTDSHTSSDSLTPTTNSGPQHFSCYFMTWTVSLSVVWTTDRDSVCGILNNWVFIIHTSCWFAYIWNVFASNLSLVTSSLRWRDGTEVRDEEEEDEDRDRSNESDDGTGRESRRGRRGEKKGQKCWNINVGWRQID